MKQVNIKAANGTILVESNDKIPSLLDLNESKEDGFLHVEQSSCVRTCTEI